MDTKIVLTIAIVAASVLAVLTASTIGASPVFSQNASQGAGAALNQTGKTISNTLGNAMQGLKSMLGGNSTK